MTRRERLVVVVSCGVLIAIPFVFARLPPITDLPQQVAQIRLFLGTLHNDASPYRIQWFTPHSLSYGLLGLSWALFAPLDAGRMAMLAIAWLWIGAAHLLAAKRNRPVAAAILVSALFFNQTVYWGFFSFAIGWPVFALWFLLTTSSPSDRHGWKQPALFFGTALLLYVSHALWFAAGMVWLAVITVTARVPLKAAVVRFASVFPVMVAAAVWFPHLSASRFISETIWGTTPTARLSFSWAVNNMFGGLQGPVEYVLFFAVVMWIALALWQHRRAPSSAVDRDLLIAAAMFFGGVLLLPDLYMNTTIFAGRWMPVATILLVLALPAPQPRPALQRTAVLAVLAGFCVVTALAWKAFERQDLAGFQELIEQLPAAPRVIGLDMRQRSPVIKGRPCLQAFAYTQVLKGGELNMSFAEFAPSLVVYRSPREAPWTNGLEWYPERIERSDFQYFDYAIINADAAGHDQFRALPELIPVAGSGYWRLYRITAVKP